MAMEHSVRPLARYMQCARHNTIHLPLRTFTTTAPIRLETEQQSPSDQASPPPPPPASGDGQPFKKRDPYTVSTAGGERQLLLNQRLVPIGSRRRRAAIASTSQIPFSQLPYQCFQEARSFLQEDRKEKLEAIRVQRGRIERLRVKDVAEQDSWHKEKRLKSMRQKLEELKIHADINDPVVKKRFEDGKGDMTKPIYRFLADRQWRAYTRVLLMQRLTQMNVVPDVLPTIDPVVSTTVTFPATNNSNRSKRIQHGDIVDSLLSAKPPTLWIQPYNKGTRLVTIAVVNPDVPNVAKDGFDYRCHFLAANIPISPTDTRVNLATLQDSQVLHNWLPPYAQKGSPYQRLSVFILEQQPPLGGEVSLPITVDINAHAKFQREGFNLRAFVDRYGLQPVGADLFRTVWDDNTAGVMSRAGVEGWDVEFKRKRVEPLPYKRMGSERYR